MPDLVPNNSQRNFFGSKESGAAVTDEMLNMRFQNPFILPTTFKIL